MSDRVIKRPLDPAAVKAADQALWKAHGELGGRKLTLLPKDRDYRKEWVDLYQAALKPAVPPAPSEPPPPPPPAKPSDPVAPCPPKPAGSTADEINKKLDEASWLSRDDVARDIVKSLTREQIRALPEATRKRLKDELNSGWVSADDKAALKKIWQAEHEDAINKALKDQRDMLEARKKDLENWDDATKADFKRWFGKDDAASRKKIADRVDKELELNKKLTIDNFAPADPPEEGTFAYVYPNDKTHTIYLDSGFDNARATGLNSKAGTLAHETSHFNDIGGTDDHAYGPGKGKSLAKTDPDKAMENADSFEYFVEKVP